MQTSVTAADFFAAKLAYETGSSDLATARASGESAVVIGVRSEASWDQGRIPGAIHIPNAVLADRVSAAVLKKDDAVLVYCWCPGCNGSTRAALTLARRCYSRVRELIGGFEYWSREGLAVVSDQGRNRREADPLTAPLTDA